MQDMCKATGSVYHHPNMPCRFYRLCKKPRLRDPCVPEIVRLLVVHLQVWQLQGLLATPLIVPHHAVGVPPVGHGGVAS
jgi:hypothetical protein